MHGACVDAWCMGAVDQSGIGESILGRAVLVAQVSVAVPFS